MKSLFFDQWKQKRFNKIVNVFGSDWFQKKDILELGACHGDMGIEFMKLGSNVVFSDAREEHLLEIPKKINFSPELYVVDQNKEYDFNKKFDLILHLGVLYHLENWKQDLKCAIKHSKLMILETSVNPRKNDKEMMYSSIGNKYMDFNSKRAYITQDHVEEYLTSIGCSFIRLDTNELNCNWSWSDNETMISFLYDWNHESYEKGFYNEPYGITNKNLSSEVFDHLIKINNTYYSLHFKRMWLVINNKYNQL